MSLSRIITIGLSPAWDTTCIAENINWGDHKRLDSYTSVPAGKAFNASRALAWLGVHNIAAGIWGQQDYRQMLAATKKLSKKIDIKLTAVPGTTRQCITIVDSANEKEMHLRSLNTIADIRSLRALKKEFKKIVRRDDMCLFCGTAGDHTWDESGMDVLALYRTAQKAGSKLFVDSSGRQLITVVEQGGIFLLKPNVQELGELLGKKIKDEPDCLIRAAKPLLKKAQIIVISRGDKGLVAIDKDAAYIANIVQKNTPVRHTVGCGDYLFAGLAAELAKNHGITAAIKTGMQAAAARAFGWTEYLSWPQCRSKIPNINIRR